MLRALNPKAHPAPASPHHCHATYPICSPCPHRRVRKAQEELIGMTQENTTILREIGGLSREQRALEEDMNPTVADGADDEYESMKQQREQDRLIAVVKLQARQVDALKAEIAMLRTKGGHVYAGAAAASQM